MASFLTKLEVTKHTKEKTQDKREVERRGKIKTKKKKKKTSCCKAVVSFQAVQA